MTAKELIELLEKAVVLLEERLGKNNEEEAKFNNNTDDID